MMLFATRPRYDGTGYYFDAWCDCCDPPKPQVVKVLNSSALEKVVGDNQRWTQEFLARKNKVEAGG